MKLIPLKQIVHFIGGIDVSNNGNYEIFKVGTTAILKWYIVGVPNGIAIGKVYYYTKNKAVPILASTFYRDTFKRYLNYRSANNNPFVEGKVTGLLELNKGSGALTLKISKARFNDSGVFRFGFVTLAGGSPGRYWDVNNITLEVKSK